MNEEQKKLIEADASNLGKIAQESRTLEICKFALEKAGVFNYEQILKLVPKEIASEHLYELYDSASTNKILLQREHKFFNVMTLKGCDVNEPSFLDEFAKKHPNEFFSTLKNGNIEVTNENYTVFKTNILNDKDLFYVLPVESELQQKLILDLLATDKALHSKLSAIDFTGQSKSIEIDVNEQLNFLTSLINDNIQYLQYIDPEKVDQDILSKLYVDENFKKLLEKDDDNSNLFNLVIKLPSDHISNYLADKILNAKIPKERVKDIYGCERFLNEKLYIALKNKNAGKTVEALNQLMEGGHLIYEYDNQEIQQFLQKHLLDIKIPDFKISPVDHTTYLGLKLKAACGLNDEEKIKQIIIECIENNIFINELNDLLEHESYKNLLPKYESQKLMPYAFINQSDREKLPKTIPNLIVVEDTLGSDFEQVAAAHVYAKNAKTPVIVMTSDEFKALDLSYSIDKLTLMGHSGSATNGINGLSIDKISQKIIDHKIKKCTTFTCSGANDKGIDAKEYDQQIKTKLKDNPHVKALEKFFHEAYDQASERIEYIQNTIKNLNETDKVNQPYKNAIKDFTNKLLNKINTFKPNSIEYLEAVKKQSEAFIKETAENKNTAIKEFKEKFPLQAKHEYQSFLTDEQEKHQHEIQEDGDKSHFKSINYQKIIKVEKQPEGTDYATWFGDKGEHKFLEELADNLTRKMVDQEVSREVGISSYINPAYPDLKQGKLIGLTPDFNDKFDPNTFSYKDNTLNDIQKHTLNSQLNYTGSDKQDTFCKFNLEKKKYCINTLPFEIYSKLHTDSLENDVKMAEVAR
ncbi:hypothetical protein [Facilibium subflavum]|uniref:hypothetical protein n=1 Tax=Facilibium subflavum TaxID=2219058 RepID=UPI000E65A6B3|nr:hypothetical protein [Facilibium subflavum]